MLGKHAGEGIESIENMKILQIKLLNQLGSPMKIVELFRDKLQYQWAMAELERKSRVV